METKRLIDSAPDKRFALLIDADNVSAKYIKPILTELSKYGTITYKRIYGDWTLSLHAKWKDALLENSITPIQQFSYTYGKNAAESVEGFCIVSSDSDFTRLASRLRESGRTVIGMGEKKTPTPFRKACDIFTVLELLVKNERSEKASGPTMSKAEVEQAVIDIIIDNQNNGKATGLGEIGSRLQKRYPDFDVRNYGTNLLSKLLGEFTRIKITKDHSSVAVEIVDSPEVPSDLASEPAADVPAAEKTPQPKGKEASRPSDQDGAQETAGAAANEEPSEKSARKPRRKRKIVVNGSSDSSDNATNEEVRAEEPTSRENVDEEPQPAIDSKQETPVAETIAPEDGEAPAEQRQKKSSRSRRGGARRRKQANREAIERTPQVRVREVISRAGDEGIALGQLAVAAGVMKTTVVFACKRFRGGDLQKRQGLVGPHQALTQ